MMNTKTRIKSFFTVLVLLVMSFSLSTVAHAAGNDMGFYVEPVFPSNQRNSDLGYFDVRVSPAEAQTLEIVVSNQGSKDIVVEVEAVSASTSLNGSIDYITPGVKDDTLKHSFSDIAKFENKEETIPANGKKTVGLKVILPNEKFDGIILGGIRVKDITHRYEENAQKEEISSESGSSVQIFNEYEYVLSVVLSENDNAVEPNFELVDIMTDTINYRAAIVPVIRNSQPIAVKKAVYNAAITPKNSSNPVFQVTDREVEMAPNSIMNYAFTDEAGYGIDAGTYSFKGSLMYNGKLWEFEKEFTIEQTTANKVNSNAANQQTVKSAKAPVALIAISILALIIIVLLVFVILKLGRKKS